MKKQLSSWLLIVILILQSSPATAGSKAEWGTLYRGVLDLHLSSHFVYLAKDLADLELAIAWKLRGRNIRSEELRNQLTGLQLEILRKGTADQKLFRQFFIAEKEMVLHQASAEKELGTLQKVETVLAEQCDAQVLDRRAAEFDSTSLISLNETLNNANRSIQALIDAEEQVGFSITYSSAGGGYTSFGNGGGSGPSAKQTAIAIGTTVGAAIGSLVPVIGTFIGAVIGFLTVTIIWGLFDGGETLNDKTIDTIRDEMETAKAAWTELGGDQSRQAFHRTCKATFQAPSFKEALVPVAQVAHEQVKAINEKATGARQLREEMAQNYQNYLSELATTGLQIMESQFAADLDAYFQEGQERSREAKVFYLTQLAPVLSGTSSPNLPQRLKAAEKSWEKLIEGDAKFTDGDSFYLGGAVAENPTINLWLGSSGVAAQKLGAMP